MELQIWISLVIWRYLEDGGFLCLKWIKMGVTPYPASVLQYDVLL